MKGLKLSGNAQQLAILIGAGAVAFIAITWFLRKQVTDAASAVANVNEGTPYAGTGVVGTVGHGFDTVSGGLLSDVGSWIGGKVYDWTHDEYDPNAPVTSNGTQLQTRKQAVSDGFWGGFTDFFTPSP